MDLLHALTTFTRIVETGSFSAVARENNTAHSAVTRLVGQLEAHFGVRLFHRTTRRLSLTEDGQDLLGHARHLIEVADEIITTISKLMLTILAGVASWEREIMLERRAKASSRRRRLANTRAASPR
jgi:DNA-binding transcriptional LysR family regulator